MEYQEFIKTIKENLEETFGEEVSITVSNLIKNNGTSVDTLVIRKRGINIAPSIYLNPYYSRYISGMALCDIMEDIKRLYWDSNPDENFDLYEFYNYEKVKIQLEMRLINRKANEALLKDVPHVVFLDLAIVFRYVVEGCPKGKGTILITNDHLAMWGISVNQLYADAKISTPLLSPAQVRLLEGPGDIFYPFYVVTNNNYLDGAVAVLYDGLLYHLANYLESDLLLIPSSIHEMLALPLTEEIERNVIDTMIISVNELELADNEILADHTYLYHCDTDSITL